MVVQVNDVGMVASELRIGNYIYREDLGNSKKRIEKVLELTNKKALCSGPLSVYVPYEDLEPIPLAEEILKNAGFDFDKENEALNIFVNSLKITVIDKLGKWMIYLSGPFGMVILNSLKYLHQLQNLFHSLSGGQELNVKL